MNSSPNCRRVPLHLKIAFVVCAIVIPHVSRAQELDAQQILKRAAATYQSLKTYDAHITVDSVENEKTSERHFTEIGAGPAYRSEEQGPLGLVRVDDGKTAWAFDPATNQYTKSASSGGQSSYVSQLAQIDQNVKAAQLLREDVFDSGGKRVHVYIVEVTRDPWPAGTPPNVQFETVRIDESSFEIYGANVYTDGATEIFRYSIVRTNQPIPHHAFVFYPPASAMQVASLAGPLPETSSVIDKEAPDFTLADASGRSYHLHDLRGKVVVIDFWATWCPPCRAQMPYLQRIHDKYSAQGVVVLGLDSGEDAKQVTAFANAAHYNFPLLLGAEPNVTAQYFVDAFPTTLVVGRDGRIAFRAEGMDGPNALIAAINSAVGK